jgi:uncharacterized protein YjbI with pentapeptide repeats
MCKYSKRSWNCPYEKLPDSEYCIFHLEDENKNADEFNRRINELFDSKDQDINFNGFIFSHGTTIFDKKYFNKNIYKSFTFFDAKFLGMASFIDTEFHGITHFVNTEFGGTTYFSRAKFFKPVLKEYDHRTKNVEFDGATFFGEARFKGTLFSVNVSFSKARFLGETHFSASEFSKDTFFNNSEFTKSTYFYDAKFLGRISFYYATSSDYIGLNGAKFCINSDADFRSVKLGITSFERTEFFGKIDFSNAQFLKHVYFNKAEFENVCFDNAIFSGETEFRDIKFLGEASFIKSEFLGKTIFQEIELYSPIRFSFATFAGKFDLILHKSKGIFLDNVFFGEYVRIKANLTRSYFQGSNIEIVDLADSEWDLKDNNSIKIWEDYQRELNFRKLEGIYRRLKQSYQRHGNYSTSGKFYYREMDLHGEQLRFLPKL